MRGYLSKRPKSYTTYRSLKRLAKLDDSALISKNQYEKAILGITQHLAENITLEKLQSIYPGIKIGIVPNKKDIEVKKDVPLKNQVRDVVIQFHLKDAAEHSVESRVAIFSIEKQTSKLEAATAEARQFMGMFGNVDFIAIPKESKSPAVRRCAKQDIQRLKRSDIVNIAMHLDHGQTLNIANLGKHAFEVLSKHRKTQPTNPYSLYLYNFCTYYKDAPHGKLMMQEYPDDLVLLHETKMTPLIKQSKQLKAAAAGCLGSVVYTTKISKEGKMGSHTLALNSRMNNGQVDKNNFVYLKVENKGNGLTNWMERLGCGRLWVETMYGLEEKIDLKRKEEQPPATYAWAKQEFKELFEQQSELMKLQNEWDETKFNSVKYVAALRIHDDLLRAREIISGVGDKFYEKMGPPNSHNYLAEKQKFTKNNNEVVKQLETKLNDALTKANSWYLSKLVYEREQKHYRDRVKSWMDRTYKGDADLKSIQQKAESVFNIKSGPLPIEAKLNKIISMRTSHKDLVLCGDIKDAILQKVSSATQKIAIKTQEIKSLEQLKNTSLMKKELPDAVNLAILNLKSEIASEEKFINAQVIPNDMKMKSVVEIHGLLPRVLSLQDQLIRGLLDKKADINSEQEYKQSLQSLFKLVNLVNDSKLTSQINEELHHNRARVCLNNLDSKYDIIGSLKVSDDNIAKLCETIVSECELHSSYFGTREVPAKNLNDRLRGYFDDQREYKELMAKNASRSDYKLMVTEHKKNVLSLALNENANPAAKQAMEQLRLSATSRDRPAQDLQKLQLAYDEVIPQYKAVYPFLQLMIQQPALMPTANDLTKSDVQSEIQSRFNGFWDEFDRARRNIPSDRLPSSSLLNGILFESIKDFILLYQQSSASDLWEKEGSFEMENQYEIFFSMMPSLGIAGEWNNGRFLPSWETIVRELNCHHLPMNTPSAMATFQSFLMSRFSYYFNVACLEGMTNIPDPSTINSFDDLARELPNLSGVFVLSTAADLTSPSPFWSDFQKEMRDAFESSHNARQIYVPIKSGVSGTAEIGVRAGIPCNLYEVSDLTKSDESKIPHYVAIPAAKEMDVKVVSEISTVGGLTGDRYEAKSSSTISISKHISVAKAPEDKKQAKVMQDIEKKQAKLPIKEHENKSPDLAPLTRKDSSTDQREQEACSPKRSPKR